MFWHHEELLQHDFGPEGSLYALIAAKRRKGDVEKCLLVRLRNLLSIALKKLRIGDLGSVEHHVDIESAFSESYSEARIEGSCAMSAWVEGSA